MAGTDAISIDLNSDVGESFGRWELGDDAAIFKSVSSANVACGFHAGDPAWISATCRAAAEASVTVGAHPAYRDLQGFGRRFMDVAPSELTDDVVYQIGALQALAARAGTAVKYVKPHGALYNTIVHHEKHAQAVVDAVKDVDPSLPLMVLPNSEVLKLADKAGLRTVQEAFADRTYNPDGTLVSRREAGAVLHNTDDVVEHVLRVATESKIKTTDGTLIDVDADSICLHGDSPGAVDMSAAVRDALREAGITIKSFA